MRLVNTDGMALLGPGSEWFWTMLQFAALAITFVAIYRQLRAAQRQTAENAKVLRSQAHYNASMLSQRPWEMLIQDESLARVVSAGYDRPATLDDAAWARFSHYVFMQLDGWEYLYYQHRDGAVPEELWAGADAYFRSLVRDRPGIGRFWSQQASAFAEPFRSYVEAAFADVAPTAPA